jgi:hypothetical protein
LSGETQSSHQQNAPVTHALQSRTTTEEVEMTAQTSSWQAYDAATDGNHPRRCAYADCPGRAILIRHARAYCRAHASMYGAQLWGRNLVSLHGRT